MQVNLILIYKKENDTIKRKYFLDVKNVKDLLGQTKSLIQTNHTEDEIIQCRYAFTIEPEILNNVAAIDFREYKE